MRFSFTLLAITASTMLSIGPVHSADKEGNYAVWGMGNQSCNAYNKARAADKTDPFKFYVMGYLTAYNVHQGETYSISAATPMPEIMTWFDEYCDSHAVHSFENALMNFVSEHYEERLQKRPEPFRR